MTRKNRKKRSTAVLPVPFAGVVVVIATIGLAYTWLDCRCDALGSEICQREQELKELRKELQREESRWLRIKSTRNIRRALELNGIVMTWPGNDQVVRLYDPDRQWRRRLAESRPQHAAADPSGWPR